MGLVGVQVMRLIPVGIARNNKTLSGYNFELPHMGDISLIYELSKEIGNVSK